MRRSPRSTEASSCYAYFPPIRSASKIFGWSGAGRIDRYRNELELEPPTLRTGCCTIIQENHTMVVMSFEMRCIVNLLGQGEIKNK
jgi:hypothetical protein